MWLTALRISASVASGLATAGCTPWLMASLILPAVVLILCKCVLAKDAMSGA